MEAAEKTRAAACAIKNNPPGGERCTTKFIRPHTIHIPSIYILSGSMPGGCACAGRSIWVLILLVLGLCMEFGDEEDEK